MLKVSKVHVIGNQMKKIKILHQVLDPSGIGGVSSEFRALQNSKLSEKYDFKAMILKDIHAGINLHDILFYLRQIKKYEPDIVHIRGAAIDGLNAIIAARIYGKCKILTTVHGMYSDLVYISSFKRWISKNIIERAIFMLSHGISCVCQNATKRKYFNAYRKKMLPYVYNRMPHYDIELKNTYKKLIRLQYGIDTNDLVCVLVGRMTREKGLLTLEKMFSTYSFPSKLVFLFVGDGDYKKQFEENCKRYNVRTIFTGMQTDVKQFYFASDMFLQPSLHENHSIALLEACAAGIPSIATNCGGNSEIVYNGYTGKLIHIDSPHEMYDAIIELCNTTILSQYSKNVQNMKYPQFSDEECDNALDSVYKKILKNE